MVTDITLQTLRSGYWRDYSSGSEIGVSQQHPESQSVTYTCPSIHKRCVNVLMCVWFQTFEGSRSGGIPWEYVQDLGWTWNGLDKVDGAAIKLNRPAMDEEHHATSNSPRLSTRCTIGIPKNNTYPKTNTMCHNCTFESPNCMEGPMMVRSSSLSSIIVVSCVVYAV